MTWFARRIWFKEGHSGRALKKNGRPCRAPALRAGSACFWHAPESTEAAAEARRLGGLRRRREGTIGGAYAALVGVIDRETLLQAAFEQPNSANDHSGGDAGEASLSSMAVPSQTKTSDQQEEKIRDSSLSGQMNVAFGG